MTDVPIRMVETEWGVLRATTTDGGNVRVRTQECLVINQRDYVCDVGLSLRQLDQSGRQGRWYIDDVWHAAYADMVHGIREHPYWGRPTADALVAFRDQVLPAVAAWLNGAGAISFLQEGHAYWLGERGKQAETAMRTLVHAFGRVERIQAAIGAGLGVKADDQRLLDQITCELPMAESEPVAGVQEPVAPEAEPGRPAPRLEGPGL